MSNNIFCARAEPAGRMNLALSSYQTICNALMRRMRAKLNTENVYLLTDISNVIHQLGFCEKKFNFFKCDTRSLSKNIVFALQDNSTQMLETVRSFESFIRPVEHDWVTIPRDIKTQCNFVCDALYLVAAHMCLLNEVATLSRISRIKWQTEHVENIQNQVVKMRAVTHRTYVLQQNCKKSLSPKADSGKVSEKSSESNLTPPPSDTKQEKNPKHVPIPIIDAMSSEITDRDIATLVFKWTTLDKFNKYNRVRQVQPSSSHTIRH